MVEGEISATMRRPWTSSFATHPEDLYANIRPLNEHPGHKISHLKHSKMFLTIFLSLVA
jgi:hypothetical protein